MKQFVLATTNAHKLHEFRASLHHLNDWQIVPQPDTIAPIEETGSTFVENAILKSIHVSRLVEGLVVGDDSGLCVDALNDRPGIFSARYADTAAARIRRVLNEMKDIPDDRRHAEFVCALAVARGGSLVWTTEGRVEGEIVAKPSGSGGFGYDPIFRLPELGRTMAELTTDEKNRISHRGRALQQLAEFLSALKTPDS